MKFIKGARNWRLILGTQTFFLASDPPPRGAGKIRQDAVACQRHFSVAKECNAKMTCG